MLCCSQLARSHPRTFSFSLVLPNFPAIQTKLLSTLSTLFDLCTKPKHLQQIHGRFILLGLHQNLSLSSKLIQSYTKLGLQETSLKLFRSITNPDKNLYNTIIQSLSKLGDNQATVFTYNEMVVDGICPDESTFPVVLKSCSCLSDIVNGRKIHGHVVKMGFAAFEFVGSALLDMYRSFGIEQKMFDERSDNDVDESNESLGYSEDGLGVIKKIIFEGNRVNLAGLIDLLRCSVDLDWLTLGRIVHSFAIVCGLWNDLVVSTGLLTMYSKLRSLEEAKMIFDHMLERDNAVWNVIISTYARNRYPRESVGLFLCMLRSGMRPDFFTVLAVVPAIAQLKAVKWGKELHAHIVRNCLDYQVSVYNSVIDMYCECDCVNYARVLFDQLENKSEASWSAMIKGYVMHDQSVDALSLFSEMRLRGWNVDFITIINILPACVNVGALEQVKNLHGYAMKSGLALLPSVSTAILVSYAKCGCIGTARIVFNGEKFNTKDIVAWNSMLSAYAKHGQWSYCFDLYDEMKQAGVRPDNVTFCGLFSACVNSGLVELGKQFFKEMVEVYGCQPDHEHYASLVDLLGRSGKLDEAKQVVMSMPFEPDARVWGPLLNACKMHSETGLAEFAAQKLIKMEPSNAANYILLSNMYAAAGKWDGVAQMRSFLRQKDLKKTPGCSWLEINGEVHEFRVADKSHEKSDNIYGILKIIELQIMDSKTKVSSVSCSQFSAVEGVS